MNPKLYTDYTINELLSELAYLGRILTPPEEKIDAVKTEIKKRLHLIEANRNRL